MAMVFKLTDIKDTSKENRFKKCIKYIRIKLLQYPRLKDITWLGIFLLAVYCSLQILSFHPRTANEPDVFRRWSDLSLRLGLTIIAGALLSAVFATDEKLSSNEHDRPKSYISSEGIEYVSVYHGVQINMAIWGLIAIYNALSISKIFGPEHRFSVVVEMTQEVGFALFVAALVSGVFDIIYHDRIIGKPLKSLNEQIDDLNNIVGYKEHRDKILEGFTKANNRIISVSDNWVIDSEWWKDHTKLSTSNLYRALTSIECRARSIVFAGKMPWPEFDVMNNKLTPLEPSDFHKVLGIAWRYIIASEVRRHRRASNNHELDIRIVYAEIPISATVIDNSIYFLVTNAPNVWKMRGTQLTGRYNASAPQSQEIATADAFQDLLERYVSHSRSAREYLESLFYLISLAHDDLNESSTVGKENIERCLDLLGLEKWTEGGSEYCAPSKSDEYQLLTPGKLRECAIYIVTKFFERLPLQSGEKIVHFESLRKDLI